MFKSILTAAIVLSLCGCVASQEAYYADHEFGMAQNDAFDQQVAYKNGEYAGQTPMGMPGIHSEKIMDTYQYSFDRDIDNAPDSNFTKGRAIIRSTTFVGTK